MKSTMEKLSSNQVQINFVVTPEEFEKGMQNAYKKIVKRLRIPGFRPGHAPRKVIELQYGESIFYEDAFDDIFPKAYQEAIKEHDLDPVDRPELKDTKINKGEPVEFTVTVYVRPEVELGTYKGVEVEKHEHVVEDDDVTAELERARERVSRFIDVTGRPVKMDDQVNIDYKGFVGDEQFEGGTADGQTLVIGSGQFIPGFEEQLVGKNIGDELDVSVTFPEQYHAENLAGKPAVFKVKINGVQEKEVPALDDEFAKDVSECDTLADYKQQIREKLEKQNQDQIDAEFENDVIEQAVEGAKADIPGAMVDDQVESMIRDMELRMMYQGMKLEDYMKYTGQTMDQLREMYREDAERRVKSQLVIEAIRKAEKIEADDNDVDREMQPYADQGKKSAEEFKANLSDADMEYFKRAAGVKKTIEFLKEHASVTEHKSEKKSAAKKAPVKKKDEGEEADEKKPAKKAPAKKKADAE